MIAKQLFEDLASKVSETIANSPAKDIEKNAKAMLGSAFNKMDLVTREEFDVQQQVLIKTRTKLSELEARLATLEAMLAPTKTVCETFPIGEEPTEKLAEDDVQAASKTNKKTKKTEDKE